MSEERPYWNMEMEPILNTPEMREIQLQRLKVFLRRLYEGAPFYTRKFDEWGVVPEKINSLEDFAKAIPLFDKEGLRAMVFEFRRGHTGGAGPDHAGERRRSQHHGHHHRHHRHPHPLPHDLARHGGTCGGRPWSGAPGGRAYAPTTACSSASLSPWSSPASPP